VRPWFKPCLVVYWLSLTAWLAAMAAAGLAAAHAFAKLPATPMVLEAYALYPAAEHGRIAAGLMMADLFATVDFIQFAAIPLAVVTLALQLTVFGLPARRPANIVRLACLVLAAGLFAYYAVAVAPALNGALRTYWDAARAGDLETAALYRQLAGTYHSTARLVLQLNLGLVVAAICASAIALAPSPRRQAGLPEPQLLRAR
jgi:hypothetical protein